VVSIHCLTETGAHDVRVNLRGSDIGVTQHGLHAAQIGPTFKQVRGESVAQNVRTHAVENSGMFAVAAKQLPKALPRHPCSASGDEKIWSYTPFQKARTLFEAVAFDGLESVSSDGYQALLISFSDHANHALGFVEVGNAKRGQLTDA
jgi:hypothetical protein